MGPIGEGGERGPHPFSILAEAIDTRDLRQRTKRKVANFDMYLSLIPLNCCPSIRNIEMINGARLGAWNKSLILADCLELSS